MRRPPTTRLALGVCAALLLGPAPPGTARAQAPGPERFAKPPETPLELWDAIDYLVRTGQGRQAAPYLDAFLRSNPDDATLLQIRDRYGIGSVLNLEDDPATRPRAEQLLGLFNEAARRQARDPERLRRFVAALTGSLPEQQYGVENLRRAGPYAVPYVVEALARPGLPPADHARLVTNLARLGEPALPAIVAMLDSDRETLAADAADTLGRLGDDRAIPFLTYHAARRPENVVSQPAREAIARLSGRSWASQARSPVRVLLDSAERYLRHDAALGEDPGEVWTWDGTNVAPRPATRGQFEGYHGLKLAQRALALDPANRRAQAVLTALALQKAVEAAGIENFPQRDPTGAWPLALAAGPVVLGDALRLGMEANLPEVSAAAATVLGRVADRDALYIPSSPPHPLVAALGSPDRRTRFAAAQALVNLEPVRAFPGCSRVVPALAQFVGNRTAPRAVIIDGNVNRANQVGSTLKALGYDPLVASNGPDGFRLAAETADVESIFIEPTVLEGPWKSRDLLANLRADARTASVPVFLHGPLGLRDRLEATVGAYPRVTFVVTPTEAQAFRPTFERELERLGARPLTEAERALYSQAATQLLARLALRPGNPFEGDLTIAEPPLSAALQRPQTAPLASAALSELPSAEGQQALADALLDPSRAEPLRLQAAAALARSLQRFGPLLSGAQERRILDELDDAGTGPALRAELSAVLGALRPAGEPVGRRLQAIDPAGVLAPAPAAPAPSPAPARPAPDAPGADEPPPPVETGYRRFRIPFAVAEADRERVREVQLLVSDDLGRTWSRAGVAAPDERAFPAFTAPADGEYWFAVRTVDRRGQLFPGEDAAIRPSVKVLVAADRTATAAARPRR